MIYNDECSFPTLFLYSLVFSYSEHSNMIENKNKQRQKGEKLRVAKCAGGQKEGQRS
jgi:hypothetical protein